MRSFADCRIAISFPARLIRGGLFAASLFTGTAVAQTSGPEPEVAGRSLAAWRDLMNRIDLADRESAAYVPGLVAVMQNRDVPWFTRRQAALTLGRLGSLARDAVPDVVQLLDESGDDAETAASLWSIKALALYGPVAANAAPELIRRLQEPETDWLAKLSLLETISQIGPAHAACVPVLMEAARDPRSVCPQLTDEQAIEFRRLACESLGAIGPAAAVSTPVLIRLLEADDAHLRRAAAESLARFGPAAIAAGPALADCVVFAVELEVRDAALLALSRLGPQMLPRVQPWLTTDSPLLQQDALRLYRDWGPAVRQSLPEVTPFLMHADRLIRIAAHDAVARMTGQIAPHLAPVTECLGHEDRSVRREAARLLIAWGKTSSAVKPAVERLLQESTAPGARTAAHHVLEQLEAQNP